MKSGIFVIGAGSSQNINDRISIDGAVANTPKMVGFSALFQPAISFLLTLLL